MSAKNNKKIYIIIYVITSFFIPIYIINNGLDISWQYMVTHYMDYGLIFGKNVGFTYGPLGLLLFPFIPSNLFFLSVGFYLVAWIIKIYFFYVIINHTEREIYIEILSLVLLAFSTSPDTIIETVLIMAYTVLWIKERNIISIVSIFVINLIVLYIKSNVFVEAFGVAIMFLIAGFFAKKCFKKTDMMILILSFAFSPIMYFIYNNSIRDFLNYLRFSYEFSIGYSSAMSILNHRLVYVCILFAVFVVLYLYYFIAFLNNKETNNAMYFVWMFVFVFMQYKHGFVRLDVEHYKPTLKILLFISSCIFLSIDWSRVKEKLFYQVSDVDRVRYVLPLSVYMILLICFSSEGTNAIVWSKPWGVNLNYDLNNEYSLSEEFVKEIGESTFCNYIWDECYLEKYPELKKNHITLPVLQTYAAFTPWLDYQIADFFDGEDAPEYIILSYDSIDFRWPLIECPNTWKTIIRNYSLSGVDEEKKWYLMKREKRLHVEDTEIMSNVSIKKNEKLEIPDNTDEIVIEMKNSFMGKIINTVWKTPEVMLSIEYSGGKIVSRRAVQANLINGIPVGYTPFDEESCRKILSGNNDDNYRIKRIWLEGPGLFFYNNKVDVRLLKYKVKN